MSRLVRFGVSIQEELLEAFDHQWKRRSYGNRSEAIRDLIRANLAQEAWEENGVSNLHVHLDHHDCLEVIVVKGPTNEIIRLADALRSLKGVSHCRVARVGLGNP